MDSLNEWHRPLIKRKIRNSKPAGAPVQEGPRLENLKQGSVFRQFEVTRSCLAIPVKMNYFLKKIYDFKMVTKK